MTTKQYKLSEVANNEMLDFAQYTVASRAIPNMIDGMKPVQRFYLYSSLQTSRRDFKKVSAVSGVVSDYGYNHGEVSAAGAGQLMAATWRNNICLVEGRGSFGTRQVQAAGAARYVYTKVSPNFDMYIKDIALSPVHDDPEHEPPAYYLPVLPLVLLNGASGIATGFATNIIPRSEKTVRKAIREILDKGKITTQLQVEFPDFRGTVVYDAASNRYICKGIWRKVGGTRLLIEEIPYGFDRENYIKILDDLEDAGEIVGYDDQTDSRGFRFDVKLKQQTSAKWTDEQVERKFKLAKTHAENLNVIGPANDLREYDDPKQLIIDFVDFRLGVLQQRIVLAIADQSELLRWLKVKIEFIEAVLDDNIVFKNQTRKQAGEQILTSTKALDTDVSRLLSLNILSLTKEQVTSLKKEIKDAEAALRYWKKTTPKDQYSEDLDGL
jgi:DNA gyrase/topoisomerase IV subunit A|tara:strand:- start:673 stop:1989 length:1317 start_codon:yes stop_codon:yes gene_type:complete